MVTAPFVAVSLIDNRDPVIIIGAGPTGLVSALILTELGVPVEIFGKYLLLFTM
jgi:ribulose 1,5-bisphosphate synthetase/thiazole synthase